MSDLKREARWRKPGAKGVKILLADGDEWIFAKPRVGLNATIDQDGRLTYAEKTVRSFGPDYDKLVDEFLEAVDGISEAEALLALAVDLLSRNYDLTPGELLPLLPRWFDDPENAAMWAAIGDVALGKAPKPIPVG